MGGREVRGGRTWDFVDDQGGEEGVGEEEEGRDEDGEGVGACGDGLEEVEGLEGESGWGFGGHFGGGGAGAPGRVVWWWLVVRTRCCFLEFGVGIGAWSFNGG